MNTNITRVTTYRFTSIQGDRTFNFEIPAETQTEAINKLTAALGRIIDEVNAMVKPGAN